MVHEQRCGEYYAVYTAFFPSGPELAQCLDAFVIKLNSKHDYVVTCAVVELPASYAVLSMTMCDGGTFTTVYLHVHVCDESRI